VYGRYIDIAYYVNTRLCIRKMHRDRGSLQLLRLLFLEHISRAVVERYGFKKYNDETENFEIIVGVCLESLRNLLPIY